jgi:hypothetical protein
MSRPNRDKADAIREAALDETLAATFPASDPLSTDPNPGPGDEPVRHDDDRGDDTPGNDDTTSR